MGKTNVERVVQLLLDDYERQDNFLTKPQVERLQEKRGLTVDECVEVYQRLDELGIELAEERPKASAAPSTEVSSTTSDGPLHKVISAPIDGFGAFLRRTRGKLLLPNDEIELGRRMELGRRAQRDVAESNMTPAHRAIVRRAEEAREKMIKANIRLVVHNARVFSGTCDIPFEDLVQEGLFGLIRAAEKFDHTKGYKFSTYATWWIRQSIMRGINDRGSLIRLPAYIHEQLSKLRKAERFLRAVHSDKVPSPRELADELDLPLDKVHFLLDLRNLEPASLDAPLKDSEGMTLGETLPSRFESPEEHLDKVGLADAVHQTLAALPERQREVLELRFGLDEESGGKGLTLEEVGQKFGVTRERIRQIEAKALTKLKNSIAHSRKHPLKAYRDD